MKIDESVRKETINIAIGTLILSLLMEAIFLIIGKWDYTVILGNLLGAADAVLNFFFMGLTVQSAVTKEEKEARAKMKASQVLRMFFMFVIALLGALLPCFNVFAVLIPLFFPRVTIMCRSFAFKKSQKSGGEQGE